MDVEDVLRRSLPFRARGDGLLERFERVLERLAQDPAVLVGETASSSWRTANEAAAPWLMLHGRSGGTGDAGDITPSLKGTVTGSSMVACGQKVAAELEEVVDLAVAGKEPLGMPGRLEALHLPFSSSRRLV